MDGSKSSRSAQRADLRRQFIQQAVAAFEQMFGGREKDELVTFTQREQRACALGKELSCWLLEQHAAADASVRPAEQPAPRCPKCDQPGRRVTPTDAALPERQLTTAAGEVTLRREQWRCATCRVAFFPSGPEAATGDGRLQSPSAAESGAASRQGFLQGSQ
jgi:hypothetical protein